MKRMIPSSKLTIKNDKLTAMEGIYDSEGNQIIADGGSLVAGNPEVPAGTSPTELSGLSIQNDSTKQFFKITHSPVVEANPVEVATISLRKIKVESTTYGIDQPQLNGSLEELQPAVAKNVIVGQDAIYFPFIKNSTSAPISTSTPNGLRDFVRNATLNQIIGIHYLSNNWSNYFAMGIVESVEADEENEVYSASLTLSIFLPNTSGQLLNVCGISFNLNMEDPQSIVLEMVFMDVEGNELTVDTDGTFILHY